MRWVDELVLNMRDSKHIMCTKHVLFRCTIVNTVRYSDIFWTHCQERRSGEDIAGVESEWKKGPKLTETKSDSLKDHMQRLDQT